MKALLSSILLSLALPMSTLKADETVKLKCLASDNSIFLMDQFKNDPCRIRRVLNNKEELVTGVSLCLFPNDVHSDFSFWWFVPNRSRAELVGFLEESDNDTFKGRLGFETSSTGAGLVSLTCKRD